MAVTLIIKLDDDQAEAFAQFLKRSQFEDFERRAGDDAEAGRMHETALIIQSELRKVGFSPR